MFEEGRLKVKGLRTFMEIDGFLVCENITKYWYWEKRLEMHCADVKLVKLIKLIKYDIISQY